MLNVVMKYIMKVSQSSMTYFAILPTTATNTHLNLAEEDLVPNAITSDDAPADLTSFSLRSKVEEPTLRWIIGLTEYLHNTTERERNSIGILRVCV